MIMILYYYYECKDETIITYPSSQRIFTRAQNLIQDKRFNAAVRLKRAAFYCFLALQKGVKVTDGNQPIAKPSLTNMMSWNEQNFTNFLSMVHEFMSFDFDPLFGDLVFAAARLLTICAAFYTGNVTLTSLMRLEHTKNGLESRHFSEKQFFTKGDFFLVCWENYSGRV